MLFNSIVKLFDNIFVFFKKTNLFKDRWKSHWSMINIFIIIRELKELFNYFGEHR